MPVSEKIKTVEEVAKLIEGYKTNNIKVVHAHGCFDLLHYGPCAHLTCLSFHPPAQVEKQKTTAYGSWREFTAGGFLGWHLTFM